MTRRRHCLALAAGLVALAGIGGPGGVRTVRAATAGPELLDAADAFRLVARLEADAVVLRWRIADGYYLYRDRIRASVEPATLAAGPLDRPRGKRKVDEIFGEVEIWRGEIVARLPLVAARRNAAGAGADRRRHVALRVVAQGCADIGVCYPPHEVTLALSTEAPEATAASASGGTVGRPGSRAWLDALDAGAAATARPPASSPTPARPR